MNWILKILSSFCAIFLGIYLISTSTSHEITPGQSFIARPENTVFVFDLHGVVFRKDFIGMARTARKVPLSTQLLQLIANPFFWYTFCRLVLTHGSTEEILYKLKDNYPTFKDYIPLAIDIINEQLPIEGTIALIEKLKKLGFRLYIFSNIGITTFKKLVDKFPAIFAHFDGYQVTDPADNWIQKPNWNAYKKFITSFNLESYNIVFIDDKKSNIRTAQAIGMYGILFTNSHDLLQSIKTLRVL